MFCEISTKIFNLGILIALFVALVLGSNNRILNPNAICALKGRLVSFINDKCQLINDTCHLRNREPRREVPMWMCFGGLDTHIQEACSPTCSNDNNTVCATNGKSIQIFPNRCYLDWENCLTNNRWNEIEMSICNAARKRKSYIILGADIVPNASEVIGRICAVNGDLFTYFDDECAMHYDNCVYNRDWKQSQLCEEYETKMRCDMPCDGLYRPICGFDGSKKKLFDNICIFNVENCFSGWKWRELYRYDCPQ